VAIARRRQSRISSGPPKDGFWQGRRRGPSQGGLIALIVLIVAALLAIGMTVAFFVVPPAERSGPAPVSQIAAPPPVLPPLKAGPAELQATLDRLAEDFGEPVGIAVASVEDNWAVSVGGDRAYPQQSVSKLWVALATLDAIDRGELSLDTPLQMTPLDRSVFNQPLAHAIGDTGYWTTVQSLLRHAIVNSDNSANDRLIRHLGIERVNQVLKAKGIQGIRLGADERNLQARIAGFAWRPEYGEPSRFEQARSQIPRALREAAAEAYIADPADGATPLGMVQALAALQRGELMSSTSTEFMLKTMEAVRTGPRRLKGGLPAGWKAGHKTGTGQDLGGSSIGINDVGVLTAPDGRAYSVAVLIPRTHRPNQERLALMQAVSAAVVEHWRETAEAAAIEPEA
jgi:beta-lactamase class A